MRDAPEAQPAAKPASPPAPAAPLGRTEPAVGAAPVSQRASDLPSATLREAPTIRGAPAADNAPASADAPAQPAEPPIRNLRVTFWGVQGSCPIFPSGVEIKEFARQVALYTLERAMRDGSVCPLPTDGLDARVESSSEAIAQQAAQEFLQKVGVPEFPIYGGDTSCVEVETAEGDELIFDMGTGVRDFSNRLLQKWTHKRDRVLHVFGSHEHLDHRMGLTFAGFCFARPEPFTVRVYGPYLFLKALDERYGLFSRQVNPFMHLDDPLDYGLMSAKFIGVELRPGGKAAPNGADGQPVPWEVQDAAEPVRIGATSVSAVQVYHGLTRCLAYKVRHGPVTFVYCTDHELRHGDNPTEPRQIESEAADAELARQCEDVDVAYFDGQYFLDEYLGKRGIGTTPAVKRIDWGHGCIEDVIARAKRCRVGRTYIGHHDPERLWQERVRIDADLHVTSKSIGRHIELAKARDVIDL